MKELILFCFYVLLLTSCTNRKQSYEDIKLSTWKFSAEDKNIFANASFDDAQWITISAKNYIDNQYPIFDGYSWYRCTLNVPVNWKKPLSASDEPELIMNSSRCNYQLFVNGFLINAPKEILPSDSGSIKISLASCKSALISHQKVLFAIRANDIRGMGIIYKFVPVVRLKGLSDSVYFNKKTFYQAQDGILLDTTLMIKNLSLREVSGILEITCTNLNTGKICYSKQLQIAIPTQKFQKIPVSIPFTEDELNIGLCLKDIDRNVIINIDEWKHLPYVLNKLLVK